jgi:DNA-binding winged helix-turn-helix (wHTH) protein
MLISSDYHTNWSARAISFGSFCLFPSQQLLLKDGVAVRLGSRALGVLAALVERPGEVISKRELVSRVWPDTVVEEGTLRVHVLALRRALGDGQAGRRYVNTIQGRGYCFVAPVSLSEPKAPPTFERELPAPAHNSLIAKSQIVGRARARKESEIKMATGNGVGTTDLNLQPVRIYTADPAARACELIGLWYAHCNRSERLSDLSFDWFWLLPWADDLAVLEVVDHGADFQIRLVSERVAKFFDNDGSASRLSDLRPPIGKRCDRYCSAPS